MDDEKDIEENLDSGVCSSSSFTVARQKGELAKVRHASVIH